MNLLCGDFIPKLKILDIAEGYSYNYGIIEYLENNKNIFENVIYYAIMIAGENK